MVEEAKINAVVVQSFCRIKDDYSAIPTLIGFVNRWEWLREDWNVGYAFISQHSFNLLINCCILFFFSSLGSS